MARKKSRKSSDDTSILTTSLSSDASSPPGDDQLQVDVHVCLLDAMTDHFPIKRADIGASTTPSKPPIGADEQGWGICLASFGENLRAKRPFYAFYVHKPRYSADTIQNPFPAIVIYLKQRIVAQFRGTEK